VEIFLGDKNGQTRNFLRIRASGTEPINRVYTETSDPELWKELLKIVLLKLHEFTIDEIKGAYRLKNLADILITTKPYNWDNVWKNILEKTVNEGWVFSDLNQYLKKKQAHVENRNREIIMEWLKRISIEIKKINN
jgi:hypothetical protein